MVVGTLSFVQKGQTSGCSVQWTQWNSDIWWWEYCLWGKKVKPVDAVCSGCSGIVVFDGWDIVFDAKISNRRFSGCSHTVDTVHSGRSMQWMQ